MQQLTKDLIAIDSVSGNEGEIADFLSRELETRGMTVQPFCVSGKRNNLLATWDEQPPKIVFNTHMDTVPEQYGPHEDSERIYGRGACDTHGILAAQLEALQDLHEQGVKGLGILLVVGEETNHDGALHAGNCDDISAPEVLIVGEPTENTLMASQKGCLKGDLMAYGVEGHSGYPEQYDSAVEKLIFALNRLLSASWLKKDSQTGTTLNVTIKEGGKADNQVPGFARARLMFRCSEPCSTVKANTMAVLQELHGTLPERASNLPHFEIIWDAAENESIANLSTLPGFATGTTAFNTDIAYFGWRASRTFLVGPGSILQAHKDLKDEVWINAEWISKREQIAGAELYIAIVKKLVQSSGKRHL